MKSTQAQAEYTLMPARELLKALAPYREASATRSTIELIITGVPFALLWAAAWWSLSTSYWLTLALSIPAAGFLVRLFLIQHDCGHGAFFRQKKVNDWVGRILGVFTMTPYDDWRRSHAIHHASSGNLDERGIGDIDTKTVKEYRALSRRERALYRVYRHPLVLFGVGPAYQFLLRHRLPQYGVNTKNNRWISAMGTNATLAIVAGLMIYAVGFVPFLIIQLPITIMAASIGVWLFYVQHQFEQTSWEGESKWQLYESALKGSSHYDLPQPLRWMTANIGVHHIHHLASRIPFYHLPKVLRDYPELADIRRLTFVQSLSCLRLRLWDEEGKKLVTFAEARALPA